MKIEVGKEVLLKGLQKVQNVISSKSTLPILSNILVEAQQSKLKLTATDLDIGISCVVSVDTQEPGIITIPAKRFCDIVKELPDDNVSINTKKNNLIVIETKTCQFKIMGLPYEDFPKLPEFKEGGVINVEQSTLKEMLTLTSFAVSLDETRYILNGILFKIHQNNLALVSTDGKRLAIIERKLAQNTEKDLSIIVPLKTIQELSRNLQEEGALAMMLGNNQILFDLGSAVIISRLIEGEFPDYQQVIPAASEHKINVNREQLLLSVKRAALLSTPDYQAVKMEVFKDKLVVSKSTPDIGESREELPIEYQGKEIVIGFNPSYLIDVLKNLQEEKIQFELSDTEKPGVIRMGGYVYIVLPMRLS